MKLFEKEDRSTFPYFWAHWCAVQMTALILGLWKPRFLFHDILKPFHIWFVKDYKKVQKYHRAHARHHLTYAGDRKKIDWEMMLVDWEAGHYTKAAQPLHAREEAERQIKNHPEFADEIRNNIYPLLEKYEL